MSTLTQWLRNAYEDHDRDSFERALGAVERLELQRQVQAQGQPALSDEQLQRLNTEVQ